MHAYMHIDRYSGSRRLLQGKPSTLVVQPEGMYFYQKTKNNGNYVKLHRFTLRRLEMETYDAAAAHLGVVPSSPLQHDHAVCPRWEGISSWAGMFMCTLRNTSPYDVSQLRR